MFLIIFLGNDIILTIFENKYPYSYPGWQLWKNEQFTADLQYLFLLHASLLEQVRRHLSQCKGHEYEIT